jgi:hypothetical protein
MGAIDDGPIRDEVRPEREAPLQYSVREIFREEMMPIVLRMENMRARIAESASKRFSGANTRLLRREYGQYLDRMISRTIQNMERNPRVLEAILQQSSELDRPRAGAETRFFVRDNLRGTYETLRQDAYDIDRTAQGATGDLYRTRNPRNFSTMTSRRRNGALRPGRSNIIGHDDGGRGVPYE